LASPILTTQITPRGLGLDWTAARLLDGLVRRGLLTRAIP
jgi:hypothetical protein